MTCVIGCSTVLSRFYYTVEDCIIVVDIDNCAMLIIVQETQNLDDGCRMDTGYYSTTTIIINGCVSIIDNSDNPSHPCISALAQIYAESFLGLHRIPPSAKDINSMPGESRKREKFTSDSSSTISCYTMDYYSATYSKMRSVNHVYTPPFHVWLYAVLH